MQTKRIAQVALLALLGLPAAAEDWHVRSNDQNAATALRAALDGGSARLATEACSAVLDDYALRPALEGVEPTEWLRRIRFVGLTNNEPRCGDAVATLFTSPGSRVVFFCERQVGRGDRKELEVLVLHEMLHTLGLGENPPTSKQITTNVRARCTTPKATSE